MLSFKFVGAAFGGPQIAIEFVGADIIRPLITIEFEDGNFYRFIVERRVIPHSVGKCHAVTKGLGTCQVRRSLQYSILQIKIRSFAAVYVTYVVGCLILQFAESREQLSVLSFKFVGAAFGRPRITVEFVGAHSVRPQINV